MPEVHPLFLVYTGRLGASPPLYVTLQQSRLRFSDARCVLSPHSVLEKRVNLRSLVPKEMWQPLIVPRPDWDMRPSDWKMTSQVPSGS